MRRFGPDGNARLTAAVGLTLLVLSAIEYLTLLLGLQRFLSWHVFVGLVLIPPIALKLAATGWRFLRYYTRDEEYVRRGPPMTLMRLLAPLLVAATVVLVGTGVAFLVTDQRGGLLLTLHAGSFAVWGVAVVLHVLAYLRIVLVEGLADWQPRHTWPGGDLRRALVLVSVAAGLALGLATYSAQSAWLSHHHRHRHRDEARAAS